MLKITLFNPKGIPGCIISSYVGKIYLIKGYYLTCTILCNNLGTLNSFIKDCDQYTNAQTEIREIKKVKPIFYRKYFYYSKEK